MVFTLTAELAGIKMVDKERGDLFAVILPDRSLIVQVMDTLENADSARSMTVPGQFAITADKPDELWLRLYTHGTFARCQYWSFSVPCPMCGWMLSVNDETFVCDECTFTTP